MSSRSTPMVGTDERYNPVDHVETWSQRVAELLLVGGAITGFVLANGRLGVIAGVVLLGCWMRLRVELTFVVGAVIVAVLGGDVSTPGDILAVAGLCGLLAVDLARAWASAQPAALFIMSVLTGVTVSIPAYNRVGPYWFALGAVGVLVVGLYGLYRYEQYSRQSAIESETGHRSMDDQSVNRSSATDQQPEPSDQHRQR